MEINKVIEFLKTFEGEMFGTLSFTGEVAYLFSCNVLELDEIVVEVKHTEWSVYYGYDEDVCSIFNKHLDRIVSCDEDDEEELENLVNFFSKEVYEFELNKLNNDNLKSYITGLTDAYSVFNGVFDRGFDVFVLLSDEKPFDKEFILKVKNGEIWGIDNFDDNTISKDFDWDNLDDSDFLKVV